MVEASSLVMFSYQVYQFIGILGSKRGSVCPDHFIFSFPKRISDQDAQDQGRGSKEYWADILGTLPHNHRIPGRGENDDLPFSFFHEPQNIACDH